MNKQRSRLIAIAIFPALVCFCAQAAAPGFTASAIPGARAAHLYSLTPASTIDEYALNGNSASYVRTISLLPSGVSANVNGIVTDPARLIYATIFYNSGSPNPCGQGQLACFRVYRPDGTVVATVPDPNPSHNLGNCGGISVDEAGRVYVSFTDYEAFYQYVPQSGGYKLAQTAFFSRIFSTCNVAATSEGSHVWVSGVTGHGAPAAAIIERNANGSYHFLRFAAGACCPLGQTASDKYIAYTQLPSRGGTEIINDHGKPLATLPAATGVAFANGDLFLANGTQVQVYAPAQAGWGSGSTLVRTITGFRTLGQIAISSS
jgi:hypothetical protein